jgi:hypothetical protein
MQKAFHVNLNEFVDVCDYGFEEFVVTNLNSGFLVENEFSVHLIMEWVSGFFFVYVLNIYFFLANTRVSPQS